MIDIVSRGALNTLLTLSRKREKLSFILTLGRQSLTATDAKTLVSVDKKLYVCITTSQPDTKSFGFQPGDK